MDTAAQGGVERAARPAHGVGTNLVARLLERGTRPESCAAIHFGCDGLQGVSWGSLLERVRAVSEALVAHGVGPGDRVGLLAATRLDACVADLGIMGARGVTVACACREEAELQHVLRISGARIVFVDGDVAEGGLPGPRARLLTALEGLPAVEQIVTFDLPSDPAARRVSLGVLEARGRALVAARGGGLEARSAEIAPGDAACLYDVARTQGGVTLSHGEVAARAAAASLANLVARDDVVLLAHPLASGLGKLVQAAWLEQGFHLAFPRRAETSLEDAAMVGASVILATPNLLDELFVLVVANGNALPGVQGRSFRWAMRQFDRYAAARIAGREADAVQWRIARRLLLGWCRAGLRARLGGRVRGFLAGGAPLSRRVALFFEECGVPILDARSAPVPE